jgi:hypothetical protein
VTAYANRGLTLSLQCKVAHAEKHFDHAFTLNAGLRDFVEECRRQIQREGFATAGRDLAAPVLLAIRLRRQL